MDNHLRILLRRYAATQSPEDAELVAKALLRSTDISKIQIYVFEEEAFSFDGSWQSADFFINQKDAFTYASAWLSDYLNDNGDRLQEQFMQTLQTHLDSLEAEINIENLEAADELLTQISNMLMSNTLDPQYKLRVYSDNLN